MVHRVKQCGTGRIATRKALESQGADSPAHSTSWATVYSLLSLLADLQLGNERRVHARTLWLGPSLDRATEHVTRSMLHAVVLGIGWCLVVPSLLVGVAENSSAATTADSEPCLLPTTCDSLDKYTDVNLQVVRAN